MRLGLRMGIWPVVYESGGSCVRDHSPRPISPLSRDSRIVRTRENALSAIRLAHDTYSRRALGLTAGLALPA
jgi:hypothetical protein